MEQRNGADWNLYSKSTLLTPGPRNIVIKVCCNRQRRTFMMCFRAAKEKSTLVMTWVLMTRPSSQNATAWVAARLELVNQICIGEMERNEPQMASVFVWLSWRQFAPIHCVTSLTQTDTFARRLSVGLRWTSQSVHLGRV